MTKEELAEFLESSPWIEIQAMLEEKKEDAKEELISLDFALEDSNIKAIKNQIIIHVVDEIFEEIDKAKESAIDEN